MANRRGELSPPSLAFASPPVPPLLRTRRILRVTGTSVLSAAYRERSPCHSLLGLWCANGHLVLRRQRVLQRHAAPRVLPDLVWTAWGRRGDGVVSMA